VASETVTIQL